MKRKQKDGVEEDSEEIDEDEGKGEERQHAPKRASKGDEPLGGLVFKKEKDVYWAELGEKEFKSSKTQKRVTVQSFKGHGIAISPEQFEMVVGLADQIRDAIKDLK